MGESFCDNDLQQSPFYTSYKFEMSRLKYVTPALFWKFGKFQNYVLFTQSRK